MALPGVLTSILSISFSLKSIKMELALKETV
jgi:hypothetical protein